MQYSLTTYSMKHKVTVHHRVPTSRGGANTPDNFLYIQEGRHRALHWLFDNRTFCEQVSYLLSLNVPSLTKKIVHEVSDVLAGYKWENELYAYKNWVIVPDRFIESKKKYSHF